MDSDQPSSTLPLSSIFISFVSDAVHIHRRMQRMAAEPCWSDLQMEAFCQVAIMINHRHRWLIVRCAGCGGDLEVIGVGELEHSQHTGLPIRVTRIGIFGGADTLRGIYPIQSTCLFDNFLPNSSPLLLQITFSWQAIAMRPSSMQPNCAAALHFPLNEFCVSQPQFSRSASSDMPKGM